MATRVTGEEVLEIMPDCELSQTDILPFIEVANLIVTEKLGSSSYSAARLKEIERWLSAHFISVADPMVKSEKISDAAFTYHVADLGKNLKSTLYGQQACLLDTTGALDKIGKKICVFENIDDD
jgi:hypothetical protein